MWPIYQNILKNMTSKVEANSMLHMNAQIYESCPIGSHRYGIYLTKKGEWKTMRKLSSSTPSTSAMPPTLSRIVEDPYGSTAILSHGLRTSVSSGKIYLTDRHLSLPQL